MMRVLSLAASLAMAASAGPVAAQVGLKTAAQNMRLAMDLCLRNYRTEEALQQAFANAGYTLAPSPAAGVLDFEAPGVTGGFRVTGPEGYCYIQSTDVPLGIAEDMGRALADTLFPGLVSAGAPDSNINDPIAPCAGFSIFATQTLIRVTYSAAGNSGDCINDGTSAIAIQM